MSDPLHFDSQLAAQPEILQNSKAWPFIEARKIQHRLGNSLPQKGHVLFATGYGPSGLPHIGTFGEVARSSMVCKAYETLTGHTTKLIVFSDDMDGLRKIPENVEIPPAYLGQPLSRIPDLGGQYESYAHRNNAKLCSFLDQFGFSYSFLSATKCYHDGVFDRWLLRMLAQYEAILAIMLPTLGAERKRSYSPFLPISPKTGRVLQNGLTGWDAKAGTVEFLDEDGTRTELPVTGGHCKLQWKSDWAMRWAALDVDYEMAGKDLTESVVIARKINRLLGSVPPCGFIYELFLDENGEKISKSRGNGLTIDEWLSYGLPESLSLFMFQKPQSAKRLYFDVIPRMIDMYLDYLDKYHTQDWAEKIANPVWYIHKTDIPPPAQRGPDFGLLLNLVAAAQAGEAETLWGFLRNYDPRLNARDYPILARMVEYALAYYRDFVAPHKKLRAPGLPRESQALCDLRDGLAALSPKASADVIQNLVYAVGRKHNFTPMRQWFGVLYETLLGQKQGPRMGSFIHLYGIERMIGLIEQSLARRSAGS